MLTTAELKMRTMIAIILTMCVASGSALAQGWKQYSYPDYSFTIAFPADPKAETTSYQSADGSRAEAHVYSVAQDGAVFKMMVADLSDPASNSPKDEGAVIAHAIKTLSQAGEIKVDIPARINRVFGRQMSITGADGSHASVALFYYNGRLYQLEGTAAPGSDATAAVIRFQQSLVFTGGGSNRSADAGREARRRACPGGPDQAGAGNGAAAGADQPACPPRRNRRENRQPN
jgi:hypothetical protein